MQKCQAFRYAFTLVELMIAVSILSLGVLPMMSVLLSSQRTVQALGFHMMASELAANKIDRILALPYDSALSLAQDFEGQGITDAFPEMETIISGLPPRAELQGMTNDLKKAFNNLTYVVTNFVKDNLFLISVTVFFETTPGKEQNLTFEALKFREDGR